MQDLRKRIGDYFIRVNNVSRVELCSYLEGETQSLIMELWNRHRFTAIFKNFLNTKE